MNHALLRQNTIFGDGTVTGDLTVEGGGLDFGTAPAVVVDIATNPGLNSGVGVVTTIGLETVVTFNASGSFTVPDGVTALEVLVVGGGGSGDNGAAGTVYGAGGGGGQAIYRSAFAVTPSSVHTVTVGSGGSAKTNAGGVNSNAGVASVFGTLTAAGGGATVNSGVYTAGASSKIIDSVTTNYTGGVRSGYSGGGGAGSGANGVNGGATGGAGGAGYQSSISGIAANYGGGGGGGNATAGAGGAGGGGAGSGSTSATSGTVNTGGGGGGSGLSASISSGAGGSGIVIVRFRTTHGTVTITDRFGIDNNGIMSATALSVTGVAGKGYIDLIQQSAEPPLPIAGTLRIHGETQDTMTFPEFVNEAGDMIVMGRDSVFIVRNTSGATISKGQVVYITGSTGRTPNVSLSRADSLTTLVSTIGVVSQASIANNGYGLVKLAGVVEGIDTSAFAAGNAIYVSAATAGAFTATKPAYPNFQKYIGVVLNSGVGNGSLLVNTAPFNGGAELGTNAANYAFAGSVIVGGATPNSRLTIANQGVNGVAIDLRSADTSLAANDFSVARLLADFTSTSYVDSRLYLQTATGDNTWKTGLTVKDGSIFIGAISDNANAILGLVSTTKAFMPPRMTTAQKNAIGSPASGMVVFDATLGKLCVYGAAAWETVTSSA